MKITIVWALFASACHIGPPAAKIDARQVSSDAYNDGHVPSDVFFTEGPRFPDAHVDAPSTTLNSDALLPGP